MEPAPTLRAMAVASTRRVVVLLVALAMGASAWGLGSWATRSPLRPASAQRVLDDLLARGAAGASALILAWWAVGVLGFLVLSLRPGSRSGLLRAVASSLPSPLRAVTVAALGAVVATSVAVPASAAGAAGATRATSPTATPAAVVAWSPPAGQEVATSSQVAWGGGDRGSPLGSPAPVNGASHTTAYPGTRHTVADPAWSALGSAERTAATTPPPGDGTPHARAVAEAPSPTERAAAAQTSVAGAVDLSTSDGTTPSTAPTTSPRSPVPAGDGAASAEHVPVRPEMASGTADTASAAPITMAPSAQGPEAGTPAAVNPSWTPSRPPTVRAATAASPLVVPAPRQTVAATSEVVVRAGDTLWDLCARYLPPGATDAEIAAEWPRWFEANRDVLGPDPDHIEPGQRLRPPGPVGS